MSGKLDVQDTTTPNDGSPAASSASSPSGSQDARSLDAVEIVANRLPKEALVVDDQDTRSSPASPHDHPPGRLRSSQRMYRERSRSSNRSPRCFCTESPRATTTVRLGAAAVRRIRSSARPTASPSRCAGDAHRCQLGSLVDARGRNLGDGLDTRRSANSMETPSVARSALYCRTRELAGSVRIRTKIVLVEARELDPDREAALQARGSDPRASRRGRPRRR